MLLTLKHARDMLWGAIAHLDGAPGGHFTGEETPETFAAVRILSIRARLLNDEIYGK